MHTPTTSLLPYLSSVFHVQLQRMWAARMPSRCKEVYMYPMIRGTDNNVHDRKLICSERFMQLVTFCIDEITEDLCFMDKEHEIYMQQVHNGCIVHHGKMFLRYNFPFASISAVGPGLNIVRDRWTFWIIMQHSLILCCFQFVLCTIFHIPFDLKKQDDIPSNVNHLANLDRFRYLHQVTVEWCNLIFSYTWDFVMPSPF